MCIKAILCKKHVQKGQNNKKIFFCWKFSKIDFFVYFGKKKCQKGRFWRFWHFFAFFSKKSQKFFFSIFHKSYVLGLFLAKNTSKIIKMTKNYFDVENFWKIFFWHILTKKCQKGRFWHFWHFFAFFFKKIVKNFYFQFFPKVLF